MEGVSTGATALRIRVIDSEALLLDGVLEVDRGTVEVWAALAVNNDSDTIKLNDGIAVFDPLIKEQLVNESRASARFNGQTQPIVSIVFLCQKVLYFVCRGRCEFHSVGNL